MNTKKLLALVLALVLVFSLAACSPLGKDKDKVMDGDKDFMQSDMVDDMDIDSKDGMMDDMDMDSKDGMMDDKSMDSKDSMMDEGMCMCGESSKCMADGMCAKDGCMCMKDGMCTENCMCMDGGCMKDGMCVDECMCGKTDMNRKDMNS